MSTRQATPTLRYNRLYEPEEPPDSAEEGKERDSKLNVAVTWAILTICLVGWAVIGFFLWIPRVLRAVLFFSVANVQSTVAETSVEPAGRRLRSAANFYRRGFVGAVESIRQPGREDDDDTMEDAEAGRRIESGLIIREAAWAIVVWYVILWSAGPLRGTPVDVVSVQWAELWSAWVNVVWSVLELFGV